MAAERAPDFDFTRRSVQAAQEWVGTEELHSARLPVVQEAAVLFSANHVSAAAALLGAELRASMREHEGAWRMLLELHQLAGRRDEFESAAALYAARFGRAVPEWNGVATSAGRAAALVAERAVFSLDAPQPGAISAQVDPLVATATLQESLLLSFEKTVRVEPAEAALLAAALTGLRKRGVALTILESEVFEARLQLTAHRGGDSSRPFWALLFELLILQRKHADFEEVALRYATLLGTSPPEWEEYRPGTDPRTGEQAFPLRGVIARQTLAQLQELRRHALSRPAIAVDFARVERIDYAVVGEIIAAAQALHDTGKPVSFLRLSALNAALLEAFDVQRLARLEPER
jgi:anti-anti-sigma regulatory factor